MGGGDRMLKALGDQLSNDQVKLSGQPDNNTARTALRSHFKIKAFRDPVRRMDRLFRWHLLPPRHQSDGCSEVTAVLPTRAVDLI